MKLFKQSLLLLFMFCIFLKVDVAQAETKVDPIKSTDLKITGVATSNQKVMVLHKGAWLKTTSSQDGSFTFSLPSSAGEDVLIMKSQQEDDIFRETKYLIPNDTAKIPPTYKGIQEGNWVFESYIPNATVSALVDGVFYKAEHQLRIPVKGTTTALIYSSSYGTKSDTVEIPLKSTYEIPFVLDESKIQYNHLTGKTLPNIKIAISYTGEDYLPYTQTLESDQTGSFDAVFDYPFSSRLNATFKIGFPEFIESSIHPDILNRVYTLSIPSIDDLHPVHLTTSVIYPNSQISGITSSDVKMTLHSGNTSNDCSVDKLNGNFLCTNVPNSPTVYLTASKDQKIIWSKNLQVLQYDYEYNDRSIKNFKPSSNSDILEGNLSMRFAKLKITYSPNNYNYSLPSEDYTILTTTDSNGKFKVNFPLTAGGTLSFKAALNNGEENYLSFDTVSIEDKRPVPLPTITYNESLTNTFTSLKIRVGTMPDVLLSVKLTVFRKNGAFEVNDISAGYFQKDKDFSYDYPIKLNQGDRILIQSQNNNGAKSSIIEETIVTSTTDQLTDSGTEFKGNVAPNKKIILTLSNLKTYDTKQLIGISDETGYFVIDFSKERLEGYFPSRFASLYSDYFEVNTPIMVQDKTAPLINTSKFFSNSGDLRFFITPDLLKGVDCKEVIAKIYYNDGKIEEKVKPTYSSSSTRFYNYDDYFNLSELSFTAIKKIEVMAIDYSGNKTSPINVELVDASQPKSPKVETAFSGDTHVTGFAEKETRVNVTINNKNFTAETDSNGHFDVKVNTLKYNDLIEVTVSRIHYNVTSYPITTMKAIGFKNITIKPNRKTLKFETNASKEKMFKVLISDGKSNQSLLIDKNILEVQLKQFLKNEDSLKISLVTMSNRFVSEQKYTFVDKKAPSTPKKLTFNNQGGFYVLSGNAESYSIVELLENNQVRYKNKLTEKESFHFPLNKNFNVNINSKWYIRLTDALGNSAAYRIYPKDFLSPNVPQLNTITTDIKLLKGSTNEKSTVYLKWSGKTYRTTTDDNGNFSLAIKPLNKDTLVTVYAIDLSGNKSSIFSTKVLGLLQLTASPITSKSTSVSGKGTPGSTIILYKGTKKLGSTKVPNNGIYTLKFSRQSLGSSLKLETKKATYKTKELIVVVKK